MSILDWFSAGPSYAELEDGALSHVHDILGSRFGYSYKPDRRAAARAKIAEIRQWLRGQNDRRLSKAYEVWLTMHERYIADAERDERWDRESDRRATITPRPPVPPSTSA